MPNINPELQQRLKYVREFIRDNSYAGSDVKQVCRFSLGMRRSVSRDLGFPVSRFGKALGITYSIRY